MRARLDVLTPGHIGTAARALVYRLRHLHEGYAERGGDVEKVLEQHTRIAETLANFIAVLAADDAYRGVATELRAGLEASFSSAKSLMSQKK